MNFATASRARAALGGVIAWSLVVAAGCSRITSPEELSVALADVRQELRTEMQAGDRKVAADLGARVDGLDARLTAVANELDQLSDEFDVTVERFESAVRFNAPVFFGFDEATIRDEDRAVLDRFASVIKTHYPNVLITVEGFTDPAGTAAYNRKLGMQRAEAVIEYLATQAAMDQASLRAVSYGEETQRLMDNERGPVSGQRNRRVVFVIEGEGAAMTTTTMTSGS
jgi:peptidoglycan-associated lipoprotein